MPRVSSKRWRDPPFEKSRDSTDLAYSDAGYTQVADALLSLILPRAGSWNTNSQNLYRGGSSLLIVPTGEYNGARMTGKLAGAMSCSHAFVSNP
jgi:hypothetical protein